MMTEKKFFTKAKQTATKFYKKKELKKLNTLVFGVTTFALLSHSYLILLTCVHSWVSAFRSTLGLKDGHSY